MRTADRPTEPVGGRVEGRYDNVQIGAWGRSREGLGPVFDAGLFLGGTAREGDWEHLARRCACWVSRAHTDPPRQRIPCARQKLDEPLAASCGIVLDQDHVRKWARSNPAQDLKIVHTDIHDDQIDPAEVPGQHVVESTQRDFDLDELAGRKRAGGTLESLARLGRPTPTASR